MSINRLYFENGCSNLRLPIFTDASEEAMCIVAYLQDEATLRLTYVIGKCRVAPMRHMTIPKLELQAGVYGVLLRNQILNEHDVKIDKIFRWTDSSTVLKWLQATHKKQEVFVANRAAEILENSSMDQWRHVKGVENPAKIRTRGKYIEGLKESVWLSGPAWLQADEEKWPKPWCQVNEVEAEQANSTVARENKLDQLLAWRRYSTFNRIRNLFAYRKRFKTKQRGTLKADEIHQAEQILFRFVQTESFPNFSKSIANSKEISKTLNIAELSPFIEEDGTIRVKGRLKHSNIAYNAKHPILLTAKHPVVQFLLEKAHRDNLFEGKEYVRNTLQQKYWIIGLRNAKSIHPAMADLPREWLYEHVFPFTHTGIDYFGPFEVKSLRRTMKRWCCLFTCLTTRAVHIEVAHSLDSESCLAAVTRFIAFGQQWDKELSAEHSNLFSDWCSELREIRTMSINRLYFENGCSNLRLPIFTDASEEAMCIVAYLQDEATLRLTYVIGKCRVAPMRHMTIPKLELQAGVYGVLLRNQILNEHDVKIDKIFRWTDSSTVLKWLQAAHKKQEVFVANRAAEILENSSMDQWRHVKGVENPAKIGTRGKYIEGLKESVWLSGPAWLQADEEKWPKPWCQVNEVEAEQANSTVARENKLDQLLAWRRYSTFNRIRNLFAYRKRFKTKQRGTLKADEIHQAEQILFRFVQTESFPNFSKSIANSKEISKTLNIAELSPFIEEDGTIRVKGRLKHSNIAYNAKHPILLTAKHPVVQFLLEKAHRDNLFEGKEYVRNTLQQKYWIIGLRNAKSIHPAMADLPREWLYEHVFPFTHTGIDYFGPFEVKFLRRTMKRWCCLFTCLTTRAVHIEVAHSLDSESCLAAVTRFIARRGYQNTIISDNGTNFVGAANELKAFMNQWDQDKIESDLAQKKILFGNSILPELLTLVESVKDWFKIAKKS